MSSQYLYNNNPNTKTDCYCRDENKIVIRRGKYKYEYKFILALLKRVKQLKAVAIKKSKYKDENNKHSINLGDKVTEK